MRFPGEAPLNFNIETTDGKTRLLRQTTLFEPRRLLGLIYWPAVAPFHGIVFKSLLTGLQRDALRIAAVEPEH